MTRADGTATTASRPETPWPLENLLFSAALVAQRLPWADLPARTLGLEALTREGLTRRLMAHLRSGRDGLPARLRTPFGTFVVPLTRADAEALLARADGAGALGAPSGLAPDGSRYGLSPHAAATGAWDALTEAERDALTAQVSEHLAPVTGSRSESLALDRDQWRAGMLRLSRHVVLGAAATEDTLLSEMVTAAASAAGGRSYEGRAAALQRRLAPYLADPAPGSLAGRLADRDQGAPETYPAVAHALALVSTATSVSALQALALLAADPAGSAGRAALTGEPTPAEAVEEAVDRALERALDRYPPLPALVYPVRAQIGQDGPAIGEGDEILYARRLLGLPADGERTDPARSLCGNPSGCAVARFAALVGREVVRAVAARTRPALLAPQCTADRLDRQAESLAVCAADSGWNGSEAGERFRTALLAHADRCTRAAADVRRAARWLSD